MARSRNSVKTYPTNYQQALAMVGKKIDYNTRVERQSTGGIGIVLYKTAVVEFFPEGATIVRTGGYRTPTTASRIRACGVNLSVNKGVWTVNQSFTI